jgi:hypothetical protein
VTFSVEPGDIRRFADDLQQANTDADAAKSYVQANGTFSFHQTGIIGVLSGAHGRLMGRLGGLLDQLQTLTDASSEALREIAMQYEKTDTEASARVDASYPESPRPALKRD